MDSGVGRVRPRRFVHWLRTLLTHNLVQRSGLETFFGALDDGVEFALDDVADRALYPSWG